MATADERNARLDELAAATSEWAEAERARLTKEAELAKKLLKGRVGSERLNNATVVAANVLLAEEIDQFLTE